ncbi:hypothetical protein GCM10011571_16620 [Marinithermofilum abyssi]|uniref:GMC oxidoreductase n=2 Tax=Marinithermofilum abyssi TaxID=1571185 RepID=A0A8J2VCT8_9BACL|nr:hypothetical protein GCM10011571_16620 [Marinithermofilum abyssi]
MATDMQPIQFGEIHSNVFFSSIDFIARALNVKAFDLAVNARAVKVLVQDGKCAGIRVMSPEKKSYDLKANHVIVSASTLETPRLLLNSGIKGKAIGHYLKINTFVEAHGTVGRSSFPEVLGTLGILIPQTNERPYQIQFYGPLEYFYYQASTKILQNELFVRILGFGVIESNDENRISLDPSRLDEFGVPRLDIRFNYSEKDKRIIREMAAGVERAASIMGLRLISPKQGEPPICLRETGIDYHEQGTCRMGNDPETSATNKYGQVHGIKGLYVADNSVIPSTGAANPTLTTGCFGHSDRRLY